MRILLVCLLCFAAIPVSSVAQPDHAASSQAGSTAVPVALGQSVVALTGPWKFHIGDNPQWADPAFDDSHWETVDLTPTPQTTVPGVPIAGFVSGWEARGHPGYAGYAWYRMRVRVTGASNSLTLLAPEWFDDAFQVFANAQIVGSFGEFKGPAPTLYEGNPASFTLPSSDYAGGADGSTVIAFRFYMAASSHGYGVRGGMHAPPRIGLPAAANAILHMEWEREYRRLASSVAAGLLYLLFAILIAMIFAFSRTDTILLWPMSASLFCVIHFSLIFSTNAQWMSEVGFEALIRLAAVVSAYLWLLTWWAYFDLQRARWLFNTILAFGACHLALLEFFTMVLRTGRATPKLLVAARISDISTGTAVFLVTVMIAWLGRNRAKGRQWALYIALFFQAVPAFEPLMSLAHLRTSWQPFGVLVPLDLISECASLISFSFVLFGQFRSSLQRQQTMLEDVKQAQEIQKLLIPERLPKLTGWTIESEYRPSREVGGDFFQIVPSEKDSSVLIVAGDVTGKGLQAGMLVAMLVGTIRNEAEHSSDPAQILGALNSQLCSREHAHATCLALRISADGHATLANAGHLPPYLNGQPLTLEGALPLGMIDGAKPSIAEFQLGPDDRLILLSDGIPEAVDRNGNLFGFDRVQQLIRSGSSVAEIASVAQKFGQEDDITVLSVTRTPALEVVPA